MLVDKNPKQLKLKVCDNIRDLIKCKYGITMPIRTVGEYMNRWGFTVQRPTKREVNQKPELVDVWLNKQYLDIHKAAKNEGAEIFWNDETAVQNVTYYARGYSPKGQTPVLKIQAKKMHINMISAISNRGKLHFILYSDAINSDHLIEFMKALIETSAAKRYIFYT